MRGGGEEEDKPEFQGCSTRRIAIYNSSYVTMRKQHMYKERKKLYCSPADKYKHSNDCFSVPFFDLS